MLRQLNKIYTLLLTLTVATALLTKVNNSKIIIALILLFSGIKFLIVAFQFMELKKAHVFWKSSIIVFLMLMISVIILSI